MQLNAAGRVMAGFALHATTVGSLFARLPEIQKSLALSESTFGLVLLCLPVGVVLGSVVMAQAVEKWGPKRLMLVGIPLIAAVLLLVAAASSAATLGGALFVFGLAFATSNVAINVEADRVEVADGRRIMSRCHGWWALGFLAATLVSAGLIRLGVSPMAQFALLTVLLSALVPAFLRALPVSKPRAAGAAAPRRFALPGKSTLLIGGFALAGVVLEGTTRSWSVIYVRDTFGAADWLAALALPAIVVTQTAGRFVGDSLVERWGPVPVARVVALMLLAGTIVITLAPVTAVALGGFALIGAGVSIVIPQAFSAAARLGDRPAAESMAAFATLSTLMGFLGPPLFGAAAEWLGLRMAFALFIPLPLVSLAFAGYLGKAAGAGGAAAAHPDVARGSVD
jgi:fucose permease